MAAESHAHLCSLRFRARVVLEALSPVSLASGHDDDVFDTALACDANGLPVLPATALAGVLRASWRTHFGADPVALFGSTARSHDAGRASRVRLSFGHLHDASDTPVDGLVHERERLFADPLLAPLLTDAPPQREHVALDHRGVARERGKFDRTGVGVGHRFSFDLGLDAPAGDAAHADWQRLLGLLGSPGFRLGGATRRGYGALKVVRLAAACFDLRTADGRERYAALPARLDLPAPMLQAIELPPVPAPDTWQCIRIELVPEDFWRSGQGGHSFSRAARTPDALPWSERRVQWRKGRGALAREPEVVLPASGIKGALAHRLAFHDRRLAGRFADDAADFDQPSAAVEALFGSVKTKVDGRAGEVLIDDLRLRVDDGAVIALQHNSIDRFTGGARDGALYAEEVVAAAPPALELQLRASAFDALDEDSRRRIRQALAATLRDLCEGRLALGAAQAKGHGYFSGRITAMPDWLKNEGGWK